jgi:hypothetical protein
VLAPLTNARNQAKHRRLLARLANTSAAP